MAKKTSGKKKPRVELTPKEGALVKAFAGGAKTKAEAALAAGYSSKNPTQSATQALAAIRKKAPEYMDEAGLTIPALISKHLTPLLAADETKVFVYEKTVGKQKRKTREVLRVKVPDFTTRRYGTRLAFELQGAFPPADPKLAAQVGVKVVVVDIPRPNREVAIDVKANGTH